MSLYQRKDSTVWWININHKDGRLQKSTGISDKRKAQEYHDKLKASLWEQERLGIKPRFKWEDAVVRYVSETAHLVSMEKDQHYFRWLDQHLQGLELQAINREKLEQIMAAKRAEGAANASVNRVLEIIRAVLRKAMLDWEWIDRVPRFRLLPKPKRRVRWLTREEVETLCTELPEHLVAMVKFSLETGLRKSNVTGLEWSQVDLDRRTAWIHPDQAKAGKAIKVPLSSNAVALLREQMGKHVQFVFTYKGSRVTQVNTKAWRAALVRAGIEDFRWHDLRHTWASWHVQAGTPLHVLQELGAWESAEMVRRYAHFSSEHLAVYVDRLSESERFSTFQLRCPDGVISESSLTP